MQKLLEELENLEFSPDLDYIYDLDREFDLIAPHLDATKQSILRADFDHFLYKGKFLVINSFAGGMLFLKVPEQIEKIRIDAQQASDSFEASVVFVSARRSENIKYIPDAGKISSAQWPVAWIFANFYWYDNFMQQVLLVILGKIVKHICEYGRTNFAYMKIENAFEIELAIDGEVVHKLKINI